MNYADLAIRIGASFVGKKGIKDAQGAIGTLNASAKTLGRTLGLSLSTAAVVAYGKAAVKAAAADAKSQALLAKQLENVGQAYAVNQVEAYISSTEKLSGILDDTLRPSFAKLVTATGSATQSQYLMQVAMDAAAGTGQDLESTAQALAQAYQGNTKGLKSLNLGWTQAQMKGKKFGDIIARINELYAGQGKIAADSYAGSIQKINTAAGNASETIGYALINAMIKLSNNDSIDGLVDDIDRAAQGMDKLIGKFATGGKAANDYFFGPIATAFDWFIRNTQGIADLIAEGNPNTLVNQIKGRPTGLSTRNPLASRSGGGFDDRHWMRMQQDAQKKNLQALNDNTKAIKGKSPAELALEKLKQIFDPEQAQLAAALANATDDETKAKLNALMVIKNNDEAQAKLALSTLYTAGALDNLSSALLETIRKILGIQIPTNYGALYALTPQASFEADRSAIGAAEMARNAALASAVAALPYDLLNPMDASRSAVSNVVIQISPSLKGTLDITQNASASGISPIVNRNESSYMA